MKINFSKLNDKKIIIFLDQCISSLLNFIIIIFASRFLNVNEFEIFSYFLIIIFFLLGVQNGLILAPYLSINNFYENDDKKKYKNLIFFYESVFLILSALIFYLYAKISNFFGIDNITTQIIFFGIFYLISKLYNDFSRRYLISNNKVYILIISDFLLFLTIILFMIFFALNKSLNIELFFIVIFLSHMLFSWFPIHTLNFKIFDNHLIKIFKRHNKSSKWLTLNSIITIFGSTFIHLLAGYKLGASGIASLRICSSLVRVFNIIILTLENYLPGSFSKSKKINYKNYFFSKIYNYKLQLILIFFTFLFIHTFNEEILNFFYGEKAKNLENLFSLYLFVPFISLIVTPFTILIRANEKSEIIVKSYFLSIAITILSINTLINFFNLYGAVLGLILNQIYYLLISQYLFRKHLKDI